MTIQHYRLGCPIWGHKAWVGELFTHNAKPAEYLTQYAEVFNTVEGNTTFYGLPSPSTVDKWRQSTSETFRFCFKFPRRITHDKRLYHAQKDTQAFFDRLAPLGPRLGPFLLQLPPSFGPQELSTLENYLCDLPPNFYYAVEVRHPHFFHNEQTEVMLNDMLYSLGVDRAIFDTRALRSASPDDPHTQAAQRKKPNLPVHFTATSWYPFVRYVAHPDVEENQAWLAQWAEVLTEWLNEGRQPFFFVHAPDEFYAPRIARMFHEELSRHLKVGTLPGWPAEEKKKEFQQLSLF